MKMKRKVEAKTDHRGGPKIETWERIYANYPEGVVQPRRGELSEAVLAETSKFWGVLGGVIPRQGMGKTFFTEYYFSKNEMK